MKNSDILSKNREEVIFLNEQSKENVPKNIVNTIGRDVGDRHSGGRVESRGENAQ